MRCPSSCLTVMSRGRVRSSWPFGPSTLTWPGASVTFTLSGTAIGSFPIRDKLFLYLLPDVRQYFAAATLAQRLATGHDTFAGAQDRDAQPAEHSRYLGLAGVDPQSGAADPLDARDHLHAIRAGLEDDTHRLGGAVGF